MKGIPVYPNGDPVTCTVVLAAHFRQFRAWARASRINPRSHDVIWPSSAVVLEGFTQMDVVHYGDWYRHRDAAELEFWLHYQRLLYPDGSDYYQDDAAAIEPVIVDLPAVQEAQKP